MRGCSDFKTKMEEIINRITESLTLTDAEELKSLSIFDENDNKICAIGKPKVTEREAVFDKSLEKFCQNQDWESQLFVP